MSVRRTPVLASLVVPTVLAVLLATAGGCGDQVGRDPSPAAGVQREESRVRLVDEDEANLVLFVSNQSYDDPTVEIELVVDDVTVVHGDFAVEGQHNWVRFPLAVEPGTHELTARAGSGTALREAFDVPAHKPRYAVVDHWGRGDTAELTWRLETEPVAFA